MKQCTGIAICIALVVLLLTACGSNTVTTTSQTGNQPASNSGTPVSSHTVQVTINNAQIISSMTKFMPNVPYNFVVTNKGNSSHEFIIRTRTQGPTSNQPNAQGVLYKLSSPLAPGATAQFTYNFPIETPQSSVEFTTQLTAGTNQGNNNAPSLPVQVNNGPTP